MKTKRWSGLMLLWPMLLLTAPGCLHVKPPGPPPALTMKQKQKALMDEYKRTGFMPRSGGYFVLVEEEP